jgi:hypothetical protein
MNHQGHWTSRLIILVSDLYCGCCAEELEKSIGALPHASKVTVDFSMTY